MTDKHLILFLCALCVLLLAMLPVSFFSGKREAYAEWDAAMGSLEQQAEDENAFARCLHEQWTRQRQRAQEQSNDALTDRGSRGGELAPLSGEQDR